MTVRTTEAAAEALLQAPRPSVRTTEVAGEALLLAPRPTVRTTEVALEVLTRAQVALVWGWALGNTPPLQAFVVQ